MITQNLDTLKSKSEEVLEDELDTIIQALEDDFETVKNKGVGLSAIQINIPKRVSIIRQSYVVKVGRNKVKRELKYNLYNAEILEKDQPFEFKNEGCLSIPDIRKNTQRYNRVKIKNGNGEILNFTGLLAVIAQHEMDHWDGVLFTDRLANKENK